MFSLVKGKNSLFLLMNVGNLCKGFVGFFLLIVLEENVLDFKLMLTGFLLEY